MVAAKSAHKKGMWGNDGMTGKNHSSRFAILADDQADDVPDLDSLKQRIQNIPCGPQRMGHEKARIKLEKGMCSKSGTMMLGQGNVIGDPGPQREQRPTGPSDKNRSGTRIEPQDRRNKMSVTPHSTCNTSTKIVLLKQKAPSTSIPPTQTDTTPRYYAGKEPDNNNHGS